MFLWLFPIQVYYAHMAQLFIKLHHAGAPYLYYKMAVIINIAI
jgi:hypothetical protein